MILSSQEIVARMGKDLLIEPFDPERLNANSYNLSLYHELLVYEEVVLDAASPNRFRRIEIPPEGLNLHPGVLYLGRTVEQTQTHHVVPMLHARSSLGRLGLILNPGGSLGQAGYCGTWTLEMHCIQPVRIYPGMQVCQISYHELIGQCEPCSDQKYHNSTDIQPSLLHRELGFDDRDTQLELELNFDEAIEAAR
ncbi:dCTP deaminase [Allorhodopirellula solitaria]|uniref:Deoxycytidine triphosphate deaminase n=1 Tax=Allorhodopirellula solitaria TaxID=2527987 RepID=A0A5C5XTI6_9BACT|nr:dCTP deaminase [Allorhodopirellula solitaria]TWT66576.1 Deoxycytidine triphosphate deaminase [Allorhodopirellula solitaria]